MSKSQELTIVSNRLPVVLEQDDEGGWTAEPGSGGLVAAMNPILQKRGGRWVGWPGMFADEADADDLPLDELNEKLGYELCPVMLDQAHVEGYYSGMANSILWPLFHGFPDRCDFNPDFWEAYCEVNDQFADVLAGEVDDGETLWVHDYHLINVAQRLRETTNPGRIGYFLHIPFPALQNYVKLPWRAELMRALLAYDLLGFQSNRDKGNFLDCVERLVPEARIEWREDGYVRVRVNGNARDVHVGVFPISTDFNEFNDRAQADPVAQRMRSLQYAIGNYRVLLGVDRLDYTKGLIERFRAFEQALRRHPELCEEVVLFQLVVPSRESVPEYQALKREVDRIVGRINGRFSTSSWQPIHYLYNTVSPDELTAMYRMASAAVVTPLCDGMNLVSKEYCASQVDETGVLILSEFAGAADQFYQEAMLVNPYDSVGTAEAIHRALTMPEAERRRRMRNLREIVERHDVFWWANEFTRALTEPNTLRESSGAEYLPTIDVDHEPADTPDRSPDRAGGSTEAAKADARDEAGDARPERTPESKAADNGERARAARTGNGKHTDVSPVSNGKTNGEPTNGKTNGHARTPHTGGPAPGDELSPD